MLNQPTLEKLQTLHLQGMAEAFRAQAQQTGLAELSFEERFAMLVDQEWIWRQNRALARRLAQAKFRYRASVETTFWVGWPRSTCWSSTIGPMPPWRRPSAATSWKFAKTANNCTRPSAPAN